MSKYWLQLDMYDSYAWRCPHDAIMFKNIIEKRTIRFLLGLNNELDEVRGQIMRMKSLPTTKEAFAEG